MKQEIKSTQSDKLPRQYKPNEKYNTRACPSCGMITIAGMPGGRDATCNNCGYKDPCCND